MSATGGIGQVSLFWTRNPQSDNVFFYTAYRAAGLSQPFSSAAPIWSGDTNGYVDTGLPPSTGYTYFVTATNASGESLPSGASNATTSSSAAGVAPIADADLLANTSGATAVPVATTLSHLIDYSFSASATGDLLYRTSVAWTYLPAGTDTYVLTMVSGLPAWAPPSGGGSPGGSSGQIQYNNSGAFGGGDLSGDVTTSGSLVTTIKTSVALAGSPTTTTQAASDNSTKIATTAQVQAAIASVVAGINPAVTANAATVAASDTSALSYSNGASGIGATLTGTVNTAITIDGFTFNTLGQRLLVKNDTQSPSGARNGVYVLTQLQTVSLAPVFTRAVDYDQPADINSTGTVPVISGTANALTGWLLTSTVTAVGTSPLVYTQFALSTDGVTLTTVANVISIKSSAPLPGSPTTTTPTVGDNSTKVPTTAFVATAIANAISGGGGGGGGATFSPFFNPAGITKPAAASFTLNKSSVATPSTLSNLSSRGMTLAINQGSTATATAEQAALSSSAFTLTAFIYPWALVPSAFGAAIYIKDSTGKYIAYGIRAAPNQTATIERFEYASLSGSISQINYGGGLGPNNPIWLEVQLTGGNFIFSWSGNGEIYQKAATESATLFLGSTISTVGIGGINTGSDATNFLYIDCFSWTNTSP